MITLQVTSDSNLPELRVAERTIADLIKLAIGKDMEKPTLSEIAEYFKVPPVNEIDGTKPSHVIVDEIAEQAIEISNSVGAFTEPTFNATELAEAETMGKSVCSTVVADQSTTAPVDTQVNTLLPEPTSVFGRAAQTTANAANPVVQTTDNPVRDAEGRLWDERIHSSSKELVKNGTWRKRRGVSDELIMQVDAEVLGIPMNTSVVKQVDAESHGIYTTINVNDIDKSPPSVINVIPMIDVTTIDKPPQTEFQPAAPDMTFTELLDGVTKAMVAGQLSQATITEALKSVGLEALPHLLGNPALIPAFREALGGVV